MSTLDRFRIACAVLTLWLAVTVFAHAADPNKVLHVAFPIAETGFDPQAGGDAYSNYVNRVIFDSLYIYDYLARPHKIVPNTAMALPEISADGKTWTIKVRPGIYFSDDPAFKGAKRELTATDYVFAWKRVLDPKMRSISRQTRVTVTSSIPTAAIPPIARALPACAARNCRRSVASRSPSSRNRIRACSRSRIASSIS